MHLEDDGNLPCTRAYRTSANRSPAPLVSQLVFCPEMHRSRLLDLQPADHRGREKILYFERRKQDHQGGAELNLEGWHRTATFTPASIEGDHRWSAEKGWQASIQGSRHEEIRNRQVTSNRASTHASTHASNRASTQASTHASTHASNCSVDLFKDLVPPDDLIWIAWVKHVKYAKMMVKDKFSRDDIKAFDAAVTEAAEAFRAVKEFKGYYKPKQHFAEHAVVNTVRMGPMTGCTPRNAPRNQARLETLSRLDTCLETCLVRLQVLVLFL